MTPTLIEWFDKYSESHKNKTNKMVHFICVPLIFFSLLGLLSLVSINLENVSGIKMHLRISFAYLLILPAFAFYLKHSISLFIGLALFTMACLFIINAINEQTFFPAWTVFGFIFLVAWIGQFIGHKHEGKKPSFLTDIVFLLIGPAWILSFIYRKMKIKF